MWCRKEDVQVYGVYLDVCKCLCKLVCGCECQADTQTYKHKDIHKEQTYTNTQKH